MAIPIETRIQRYQDWRQRRPVARPLVGLLWEPDIPPLPEMLAQVGLGNEVSPDQIRPETFLPFVEQWYQADQGLTADAIQPFTPAFGIPWVEAIAGCRVAAHPGSLWAEPALENYAGHPPFRLDPDNPWLLKLVEFTRAMVAFSGGRFPVALPQMRGPLDTLAALRTPAQMCLDFYEAPEEVARVLQELTGLWIAIAARLLAEIPPFHGGYSTRMKMWAPGPAITPQNDVSTLISPRLYRQLVLPLDEQIFRRFPYHSFHMHSTEHRHIDALLESANLTAIQLTLEHDLGGPPLDQMLVASRKILTKKPLILVPLDLDTAEACLEVLPPEGLAVMVGLNNAEIPAAYREWLNTHCQEVQSA